MWWRLRAGASEQRGRGTKANVAQHVEKLRIALEGVEHLGHEYGQHLRLQVHATHVIDNNTTTLKAITSRMNETLTVISQTAGTVEGIQSIKSSLEDINSLQQTIGQAEFPPVAEVAENGAEMIYDVFVELLSLGL